MKKKIIITLSILSLLIGCIVSGCSKSNQNTTGQGPLKSVTLQLQSGYEARSAGYFIALNKGYYLDEGLDVTIQTGNNTSKPEQSLLSGNASLGITTLPRFMVLKDKGAPLVHWAQIFSRSGSMLAVSSTSNITKPVDFMKKRITITPDNNGLEVLTYLGENGVSHINVQISEDPQPYTQLLGNKTDAALVSIYKDVLELNRNKPADFAFNLIPLSLNNTDLPMDCLISTADYAKNNPELCQKFVRATIKGWQYAYTNQSETISIVSDYDKKNTMDKDLELQGLKELFKLMNRDTHSQITITSLDSKEFDRVSQLLWKHQLISKPLDKSSLMPAMAAK
jgi:NitT/TauT family transport system substrate-binding protein